jgi:prophage regulatory protein
MRKKHATLVSGVFAFLGVYMKMLRMKQVLEIVPVSKSTVWQWVKDGKFPVPSRWGNRCTVWSLDEIHKFMEDAAK